VARAKGPLITPAGAKNAIKVVKIIAPVVIPVVVPYAVKAANQIRDRYDRYRARRLGVDIDQLPQYRGRGGALQARIAGIAGGLTELSDRGGAADVRFIETSRATLANLAPAVRATERMPGSRRRAAHKAVAVELDGIETELLHRLGI
jgi:hypothetical protein